MVEVCRLTRGYHKEQLERIIVDTRALDYRTNAFFPRTVGDWNKLSLETAQSASLDTFISKVSGTRKSQKCSRPQSVSDNNKKSMVCQGQFLCVILSDTVCKCGTLLAHLNAALCRSVFRSVFMGLLSVEIVVYSFRFTLLFGIPCFA